MASDSSGKKLTTAEILAKARAEKSAKGGETAPPAAEAAPPAPKPAAATPAAPKPTTPAATGKPKTTADILAAARAQKAGGAAPAAEAAAEAAAPAPAAPKPAAAGAKPKSTAEILAAARAAKGTGGEGAAAAPAAKPAAAKPAAAGAPKSTADILAAARAGKAAGAAPAAAAAKPAAAKPAAKPAAAAATEDGPKLSVEEMLAAVRPAAAPSAEAKATPVAAAAAKVPPPAPVRPSAKPAAKGAAADTRRGFFGTLVSLVTSPFVIAWVALSSSAGFAGLGLARFMLPNVLTEPPSKFKIGPPTDYDLGTVATKWVAQFGIWIVHTDQYRGQNLIYALASVCTHLGCTPSWLEGERKFKCPCHGSGFYVTGINFEGPAPRPLERVGIRLAEDGMLEVDKSVKFQEEMGQWNDPASFFEVTA